MSFLKLKDVYFEYSNGFTAVEGVSLDIEKGEKIAIVGQNGAGKTTAVKMMNGLLKPTKGQVIVNGKDTKEHTTAQISRMVGYVFQNPDEQIFNKDVYSEIIYTPKYYKFEKEEIKRRLRKALELTGIEEYLDENPYNLPYSLRKFVTIAAVIAMEPDIIILDEPTAGQDVKGMEQLAYLISKLEEEGKTVITITHDMEFVVKNFHRVIVMTNKRVIADGNKRDIFWNEEILEKSALHQPQISKLCSILNVDKNILDINECIDYIKKLNGGKDE